MLALFFNRFSKVVYAMEFLGLLLWSIVAYQAFVGHLTSPQNYTVTITLALYGFLRFCATFRFYKNAPCCSGIELHFKKAMVPTSYIMAISGLCTIFYPSAVFLGFAILLLTFLAHVNVILLYLRHRDTDPTPVNFLSKGDDFCHCEELRATKQSP